MVFLIKNTGFFIKTDKERGFVLIFFINVFLLTIIFIPLTIRFAIKHQIVDSPDHALKTQKKPVPYLGGAVLFIAIFIPLISMHGQKIWNAENAGLLLGAFIVVTGGIIDDLRMLHPRSKLFIQAVAAVCACSFGLKANLFEWPLLNVITTLLWLIGVINAFNLIDIMDGLAAGVAAISSLFLFCLFVAMDELLISLLLIGATAACLGFLLYNFTPASIYLGDAGSQLLGYLLASSALKWTIHDHTYTSLFIPILILAIPLAEIVFVSVLRIKAKRSPLKGSKDHYALRMVKLGYSVKWTVILSYLFTLLFGLLAVVLHTYETTVVYIIGGCSLLVFIIMFKLSKVDMGSI